MIQYLTGTPNEENRERAALGLSVYEQGKEALTCPHSEFTKKETGGKRLETCGANPSPGPLSLWLSPLLWGY